VGWILEAGDDSAEASNWRRFSMRKLLALAAIAAALATAACNTIAGAGADISAAGHAVTNTADDAKH
jgi:predicted small secreted protein